MIMPLLPQEPARGRGRGRERRRGPWVGQCVGVAAVLSSSSPPPYFFFRRRRGWPGHWPTSAFSPLSRPGLALLACVLASRILGCRPNPRPKKSRFGRKKSSASSRNELSRGGPASSPQPPREAPRRGKKVGVPNSGAVPVPSVVDPQIGAIRLTSRMDWNSVDIGRRKTPLPAAATGRKKRVCRWRCCYLWGPETKTRWRAGPALGARLFDWKDRPSARPRSFRPGPECAIFFAYSVLVPLFSFSFFFLRM